MCVGGVRQGGRGAGSDVRLLAENDSVRENAGIYLVPVYGRLVVSYENGGRVYRGLMGKPEIIFFAGISITKKGRPLSLMFI